MSNINNITELRTDLVAAYSDLRAGTVKPNEAKELTNMVGKIISSTKVQLEYAAARKESPDIPFLK